MVVESWIMGKLLDFNHQGLTLRFMEAAKSGEVNSAAVDQTLTNSNRELLERWLIQIEMGRGRLVEGTAKSSRNQNWSKNSQKKKILISVKIS